MSILKKPYEISVWEDRWVIDTNTGTSRLVEEKLGVIGSDIMTSQCQALEPNLSTGVNGVKKFSFKMYHKYVDTVTGEKVNNPFTDSATGWLVPERKIKLKYDGEWYDFIIKNIVENSTNYLYTYQLEDALVLELSKNGFGVVLDEKIIDANGNSNIGTANELASRVLEDTDWSIDENSEVFVQTISESLVYLKTTAEIEATWVKDQTDDNRKVGVDCSKTVTIPSGKTILAFYSSCANKPHRFQFMYFGNQEIKVDEDGFVKNENCQYYMDFSNPETQYSVRVTTYDFYLPSSMEISKGSVEDDSKAISAIYRGKRYGFAQQSKFIPVLNRYVNLFERNGKEYYGYQYNEYKSPAFVQNLISNSSFESSSGWTGTKSAGGTKKAKVENVCGYFNNGNFISAVDEIQSGNFTTNSNKYKPYLKLTFYDNNSIVINSGPFDNRTLLGNILKDDEFAFRYLCRNSSGTTVTSLSAQLGEYEYKTSNDAYGSVTNPKLTFSSFGDKDGYTLSYTKNGSTKTYSIARATGSEYVPETFKKSSKVRLWLSPSSNITAETVYYLEEIELFKATYVDKQLIPPEEQGENIQDRVIDKSYYYFTEQDLYIDKDKDKGYISGPDEFKPEHVFKELSYSTFKPKYNNSAEKVRSITAKESNYFNILQSIAETFEAWLVLEIGRDTNGSGAITSKKVCFKNYIAGTNYAGFRYGVNLKDIQRVYESKNIVTKLVVKQNSNEHAENGFCTIARAGANPTGENYIYDFQYFQNNGLMDAKSYLDKMYVLDKATGPDVKGGGPYNLQGYFPRIKAINNKIQKQNELFINTSKDLTQYKADLEVATAGYEAAQSGLEETAEEFYSLLGIPIQYSSQENIGSISMSGSADDWEYIQYDERDWIQSVSASVSGKTIWVTVNVKEDEKSETERNLYVTIQPKIKIIPEANKEHIAEIARTYKLKCTIAGGASSGTASQEIILVDSTRTDVKKLVDEYATYTIQSNKFSSDKAAAENNVAETKKIYNELKDKIETYTNQKKELNKLFFDNYSRYIQEGTWISEEYVDDEKYYADALSVMYNSCYPQVAYSINVLELSKLPGYEGFTFELGQTTYAEDPEFFGEKMREEVVITEMVENLDDPSKNTIKVQNFKNQFQDLFQKITATVQQAQYSTGSYQKAVALAEANQERKQVFLSEALDAASARLTTAGQQSVTWGNDGITVKSVDSPCDAIRMVGGAILLSKQDKNGEQKWVTGVTSDGVSASLITAGILNAGEISIMNYNEPLFRWDSYGISAFDANWYNSDFGTTISDINTKKFVRFDKHGIYGINNAPGIDGASWHPRERDIDENATFALTWEGLKVTGENGGVARIGKQGDSILKITNQAGENTFIADEDGNVTICGDLKIGDGTPVVDAVTDAIQVGGRNLLLDTDFGGEDKEFYLTTGATNGEHGEGGFYFDLSESLEENTSVVLQFKIKGNAQVRVYWIMDGGNSSEAGISPNTGLSENNFSLVSKKYTVPPKHTLNQVYICTSYGVSQAGEWFTLKDKSVKLELGNKATDWSPAPEDVQTKIDDVQSTLQKQIDGAITSHFLDGEPQPSLLSPESPANSPAADWIAADSDLPEPVEQRKHEGDLYYDKATGFCYRWIDDDKVKKHVWIQIQDEGIAEALGNAAKAQETADGKRTVFSSIPEEDVKVEEGDLLIPSEDLDDGTYKEGRVYKYSGTGWTEINYTDSNVDSQKFSWKFSPTEGMFMWNGPQTGNPVFQIYNAGTTDKPDHRLEMRGIVEAEGGSIAGWTIDSNSLKKGELGSTTNYPFHMYTSFPADAVAVAGHLANDWRLIVGNNFGVTKDGGIYATKGKIGGMEIDEIASKNDQDKSYRNLLWGTTSTERGKQAAGGPIVQYQLATKGVLKAGHTYTISFDGKIVDAANMVPRNGFYFNTLGSNNQAPEMVIVPRRGTDSEYHHYTHTFTMPQDATQFFTVGCYAYPTDAGPNVYFKNVKLVEGDIAGEWSSSPEEVGVRENLLFDSGIPVTNKSYLTQKYFMKEPWIAGQTYTVTLKGTLGTDPRASGLRKIRFAAYANNGDIGLGGLFYDSDRNVYYLTFTAPLNREDLKDNQMLLIYSMPYAMDEENGEYKECTDPSFNEGEHGNHIIIDATSKIEWIKLEKGEYRTPWCDGKPMDLNGNYSWKFSPTEGIKMWNGSQTTDPIFMINGDGLYMNGNGEFTGTIKADGGTVGKLDIKDGGISSTSGGWKINDSGIEVTGTDSNFKFNGLQIKNTNATTTELRATNNLQIIGSGTYLSFLSATSKEYQFYITGKVTQLSSLLKNYKMQFTLTIMDGQAVSFPYSTILSFTLRRVTGGTSKAEFPLNFVIKQGDFSVELSDSESLGDGSGTLQVKINNEWQNLFTLPSSVGDSVSGFAGSQTISQTQNLECGGGLTPGGSFSLGSSSKIWDTIYSSKIRGNGALYLYGKHTNSQSGSGDIYFNDKLYADENVSDERKKKNIELLDKKYEVFFDLLEPSRYKYIDGTSDRYHTGFIAQATVSALEQSGLTTQDFAAVVLQDPGTENEMWQLRRDEFVALNTWQIQKLKPRMASAEEKLIAYETRISALETEIENLKSSQNSDII